MRGLLCFVVALYALAPAAALSQGVPPHLASLAAQLHQAAAGELEQAGDDAEAREEAAERALEALRRTGVRNWAREPARLPTAGAEAAGLLGLDLEAEPDADFLRRLLAMSDADMRAALRERDEGVADNELDELVAALSALRSPEDLRTEHTLQLDRAQSVQIRWTPQTGTVVVRARSDGSDGRPEYDVSLIGRSELWPDPETGDLRAALRADEPATARVYSQRDLNALHTSILGEWQGSDGAVYTIAAAEESAGDIEIPELDAAPRIAEAEERIKEIESAIVYVWTHPDTGERERQERFRRLAEPWHYEGQQLADPAGEAEIAALRQRIVDLKREAPPPLPMREHDPAGFEDLAGSGTARQVTVTVRREDGYTYSYDEASFDGRQVSARRTYRDVRDTQESLPDWARRGLIASWSPPGWLELEAEIEPATGAVELVGQIWGLHVTYSPGFFGGDGSIDSIHTPFARPLTLRQERMVNVAQGAAETARP